MNYFSEEAWRNISGEVQIEDSDVEWSLSYDPRYGKLMSLSMILGPTDAPKKDPLTDVYYEFDFEGVLVESDIGEHITENHSRFLHWLFANVIDPLEIDISEENRKAILSFKEV